MRTLPGKSRRLDRASSYKQFAYDKINQIRHIPSARKYNLTISHEKKFVWFRVAKVGTRTILSHLKDNKTKLDVKHASFVYYPYKQYEDYFKFAFVRNPWDRLLSCWLSKVVNRNYFQFDKEELQLMQHFPSFVDFVATRNLEHCDRHLRLQSSLIDLNHVDFIGRMESFSRDLERVATHIDIPIDIQVAKNVSVARKPTHEYYRPEDIETVAGLYEKDIRIFGYNFDNSGACEF
jgi:hypothetical protein